jgi:hypothetical protein
MFAPTGATGPDWPSTSQPGNWPGIGRAGGDTGGPLAGIAGEPREAIGTGRAAGMAAEPGPVAGGKARGVGPLSLVGPAPAPGGTGAVTGSLAAGWAGGVSALSEPPRGTPGGTGGVAFAAPGETNGFAGPAPGE